MDISGEKKARYTEDEHGASNLNVDYLGSEGLEVDKQDYECMSAILFFLIYLLNYILILA